MYRTIVIINGPNLGNIGYRETEFYGVESFDSFFADIVKTYPQIQFSYFQSNCEGTLIDKLYELSQNPEIAIILNAGAYTHTSIALLDAIRAIPNPVIEVHISQIYQRESYRHTSVIAPACRGIITGFGLGSYRLAIEAYLLDNVRNQD